MKTLSTNPKILFIASYPPRECGIATFTEDLTEAINKVYGNSLPVEICALENEVSYRRKYPKNVSYILHTSLSEEYRKKADAINERKDIGMVCIQHEFGLFKGEMGDELLSMMLALNKPIITVFHTVIPNPDHKRLRLVKTILSLSEKVIVLTKNSKTLLKEHYGYPDNLIVFIPHGTHITLCSNKDSYKRKYGFDNKLILNTFGFLSENKSIETVLKALPKVVDKYPDCLYLVMGITHPEVIKNEGEKYRNYLMALVAELQLQQNVLFINKYLELDELLEYLNLSDIYLFSSKDPCQAVSGTFVYAKSAGCPVICTPIPHAKELIDEDSGILLKEFDNPELFEEAILELAANKERRVQISKNSFSKMRSSSWENTAISYGLLFAEISNKAEDLNFKFPEINFRHIHEMTTDFGILQFSQICVPDKSSGYTLDDNSRALIANIMYRDICNDQTYLELARTYLTFMGYVQIADGSFLNYVDYNKNFSGKNQQVNLEDANGRALWALGYLFSKAEILPADMLDQANTYWDKAYPHIVHIKSPRAIAFAIKGLYFRYKTSKEPKIIQLVDVLAKKLLEYYHLKSTTSWQWYEDYLTYANSVIPESMLHAYLVTKKSEYREVGEVTFDFILSHYFMKGKLKVISNNGWFNRRNQRNFFGEQPIEVSYIILSLDLFYKVCGKSKYKDQMEIAFSWFLGNNHLNQIMHNPVNGACYDGLEEKNININQGAESGICYLMARLIMEKNRIKFDENVLLGQNQINKDNKHNESLIYANRNKDLNRKEIWGNRIFRLL